MWANVSGSVGRVVASESEDPGSKPAVGNC